MKEIILCLSSYKRNKYSLYHKKKKNPNTQLQPAKLKALLPKSQIPKFKRQNLTWSPLNIISENIREYLINFHVKISISNVKREKLAIFKLKSVSKL